MDSFDSAWSQIMGNLDDFKKEYKMAFLLKKYGVFIGMINGDARLERKIRELYAESYDKVNTTKLIAERYLSLNLLGDDANFFWRLINAFLSKEVYRREIDITKKKKLYDKQEGKCAICCVDEKINKMHVDHNVPWKMVGDELDDNYQLLCETCNLKKGSNVAYKLMNMMKLN